MNNPEEQRILNNSLNYLKQLENMKYTLVTPETETNLSNRPPFWNDSSKPLPPPSFVYGLGSCCTALANLVRRLNDLPIPGNIPGLPKENCVGGTDSWFKYLNNMKRLHKINCTVNYPEGTMLIQDYNPIDQGHIAIVLNSDNRYGLLASDIIHNIGSNDPRYNKVVIEKFCDYTDFYRFTHVCYPENWIFTA